MTKTNPNNLPPGWTLVNFKDCFNRPPKTYARIKKTKYLDTGKFPIVGQGAEFFAGFTNNEKDIFQGELPVIIFGDHTRIFKYMDFKFAVGADGTQILAPKKGLNPKYCYYYLKSLDIKSRGYSRHFRYLRQKPILLAKIQEQQRIVQKIEDLFEKLNKTKAELNKIPPLIQRFRQSVLAKAFKGELVPQDPNDEPASVLLERIQSERKKILGRKYKEPEPIDTSNLPELSQGWEWARISYIICEVKPGFACGQRDTNGYLQLRMNNINTMGNLVLNSILKVPKSKTDIKEYRLKQDDILFNNTNSTELIGKSAIFNNEIKDCVYSNHLTRLRVYNNYIFPKWVKYLLINEYNKGTFQHLCHRFVGQAGIKINKVLSLIISIPSFNEQKRIVEKIEELFNYADSIEKVVKESQERCEKMTQSILAKAFRGELVPQDPNDEPAIELLRKVKRENSDRSSYVKK